MSNLIHRRIYPAQGLQKIEFFGKPLLEDFDMLGLIIGINPNTLVEDFRFIYNGDIEDRVKGEDGEEIISHPNAPFFMFDIDGKRFLSVPLYCIPSNRCNNLFMNNANDIPPKMNDGYKLPVSIKKGMKINAMIEYPLHKVPLPSGKDTDLTCVICG